MKTHGRRFALLVSLTVMTGASAAWACTGQPQVFAIAPQAGPTGIEVTVSGEMTMQGPVLVRWNGKGISEGLTLAESIAGPGRQFSVKVQVPRVSPGVYYLTVEASDRSVARATFEVTAEDLDRSRSTARSQPESSRAISGELWTGMQQTSGLGSRIEAGGLSAAENSSSAVGLGLTLSAVGLLALFGLTIATARRRRSS